MAHFYEVMTQSFIQDFVSHKLKYLIVNNVNVYYVHKYFRDIYKNNRFINNTMCYSDFIREIIKPGTINKSHEDIIYSEIDYKLNTIINPKIFFYD